jgi:hypothetical protein
VLASSPGQPPVDVTPSGEWNVRTRVHEYGGGDFLVHHTGQDTFVIFSNDADQRLYRQSLAADAGAPVRYNARARSRGGGLAPCGDVQL